MNNKKGKIILSIIMFIIILLMQTSNVQAVLQANGKAGITKDLFGWVAEVRKMEADGGTLGLNSEIDSKTLLDTGDSNGLDIHMELNTEYGAMAILSASPYGNSEKVDVVNNGTTTGNETGVVFSGSQYELTALTRYWGAARVGDTRYSQSYGGTSDGSGSRIGEAMKETYGWYGGTGYVNMGTADSNRNQIIARKGGKSIFGFDSVKKAGLARAVVVIGESL